MLRFTDRSDIIENDRLFSGQEMFGKELLYFEYSHLKFIQCEQIFVEF